MKTFFSAIFSIFVALFLGIGTAFAEDDAKLCSQGIDYSTSLFGYANFNDPYNYEVKDFKKHFYQDSGVVCLSKKVLKLTETSGQFSLENADAQAAGTPVRTENFAFLGHLPTTMGMKNFFAVSGMVFVTDKNGFQRIKFPLQEFLEMYRLPLEVYEKTHLAVKIIKNGDDAQKRIFPILDIKPDGTAEAVNSIGGFVYEKDGAFYYREEKIHEGDLTHMDFFSIGSYFLLQDGKTVLIFIQDDDGKIRNFQKKIDFEENFDRETLKIYVDSYLGDFVSFDKNRIFLDGKVLVDWGFDYETLKWWWDYEHQVIKDIIFYDKNHIFLNGKKLDTPFDYESFQCNSNWNTGKHLLCYDRDKIFFAGKVYDVSLDDLWEFRHIEGGEMVFSTSKKTSFLDIETGKLRSIAGIKRWWNEGGDFFLKNFFALVVLPIAWLIFVLVMRKNRFIAAINLLLGICLAVSICIVWLVFPLLFLLPIILYAFPVLMSRGLKDSKKFILKVLSADGILLLLSGVAIFAFEFSMRMAYYGKSVQETKYLSFAWLIPLFYGPFILFGIRMIIIFYLRHKFGKIEKLEAENAKNPENPPKISENSDE